MPRKSKIELLEFFITSGSGALKEGSDGRDAARRGATRVGPRQLVEIVR